MEPSNTFEAPVATPKPFLNIMLDTETLGTKPGCKVLSLSAVTFGPEVTHRSFFDVFIRREMQSYLKEDEATIKWWNTQDEGVRKELFNNPNAVLCGTALGMFTEWIDQLNCTPIIWCKGATFDAPVLEAAYKAHGMTEPWEFRNVRCARTLEATFGYLVEKPEWIGDKHRSLHDAVNQANYAELILRRIANLYKAHPTYEF